MVRYVPRFPGCLRHREKHLSIDQVDRTVVTGDPPWQRARKPCDGEQPHHRTGPGGSEMTRRIVVLVFGLIQIVIGARIVLLLLDAREANGLVSGILNISQVFVGAVRGDPAHERPPLRRARSSTSPPIVAFVGWTILELIVLWAVGIFRREPA